MGNNKTKFKLKDVEAYFKEICLHELTDIKKQVEPVTYFKNIFDL